MKIGILAGEIPPSHFINQIVCNIAKTENKVFIYGSLREKNFQYNIPSIFLRSKSVNKTDIFLTTILLIFKLIYINGNSSFRLLVQIWRHEKRITSFIKRCSIVLPAFLDDLDVFHIQWAKTLVYYPEFIEQLNCPVVLSLRGAHINYSPLADEALAQGYMKYFPMVAGYHAVSDAIVREGEKYGADSQKMTVIRPAVKHDLMKYIPSKKTNSFKKIKIISVGRCHWKKGYTISLDAMAILKKERVKFHYTIIAGGRDYENILYQIHDLGLSECVSFMNGLPHKEVIEKVSGSDLFLLPSVEEGISNAVLEAMALGVPVIATNCGGMAEVIENKINGFLIEVREPLQINAAIQSFSNLPNYKKIDLVNHARKTIRENHLLSNQTNQMLSFYTNAIDAYGVNKN